MVDHIAHVEQYDPQADNAVLGQMLRTYRLVLSKADSAQVAFSDPDEVARVRENYLRKKLGVEGTDAELDAAIAEVGERMQADGRQDRLVVDYLLAQRFGRLAVFG